MHSSEPTYHAKENANVGRYFLRRRCFLALVFVVITCLILRRKLNKNFDAEFVLKPVHGVETPTHLFHLHIPKTAGTKLASQLSEISRNSDKWLKCFPMLQPKCCFNIPRKRRELAAFLEAFARNRSMCNIASSEWSYTDLNDELDLDTVQIVTMVRDPMMLVRSALEHDIRLTKLNGSFSFYTTVDEKLEMVRTPNDKPKGIPIQNMQSKWLLPEGTVDFSSIERHVNSLFFVGVQEYFEHSLCLLWYKIGYKVRGLKESCGCEGLGNPSSYANHQTDEVLVRFTYNSLQLKYISEMIAVDRMLYASATRRFFLEVEEMQKALQIDMLSCLFPRTDLTIYDFVCEEGECEFGSSWQTLEPRGGQTQGGFRVAQI